MRDFVGAIQAGATNEELNQALGTTGKDFIGAIQNGATNEELNAALGSIEKTPDEMVSLTPSAPQMADEQTIALMEQQDKGLEAPVIDPAMMGFSALKSGMAVSGEVLGSLAADLGVRTIEDLISPEYKEKYPTLAALATTAGGITGALMAGKLEGLPEDVLTKEAKDAMQLMRIDEKEALSYVKGAKPQDQAKLLAQRGGGYTAGVMGGALKQSDDATRIKYADEMKMRRQEVADAIGEGDFDEIQKATKLEFDTMRKAVELESTAEQYDVTGLKSSLQKLATFARSDTSENNINRMIKRIEATPTQSLDDLLTLRQEINYEWDRATGAGKKRFEVMKNDLDAFIKKSGISKETIKLVDDSIESYSRMKKQEEFIDLLKKHTISRALGSAIGEQQAVNWGRLKEDLVKANLGDRVQNAVDMVKQFTKKYGSMDAELFSSTETRAQKEIAQTLAGDIQASARVRGVQEMWKWLSSHVPFTNATKMRKLELSISESIRKGKTQREFAEAWAKNKNTPESIKKRLKENLDALPKRVGVDNPIQRVKPTE